MSHPFRIIPCPTCHAPAGAPCPDSPTPVGVHRARWAAARVIYRHRREQRWADTMRARAVRNAREATMPAWSRAA